MATPRLTTEQIAQVSGLVSLGFKNLPDQSGMGAITFCDVVVSHEPFSDGLLFHEHVHVEQYRGAMLRLPGLLPALFFRCPVPTAKKNNLRKRLALLRDQDQRD